MISPETVEQIIDRARIDEVISDFVSLKKSGSNFKGCCPFHDEKTPSFMVSPSKGIFKCFGCGKGGNSVSFVMDLEKLSYVDALKYLAKKYNIEVVETELSSEQKQARDIRESLQIVNNHAQEYFQYQLHETNEGKSVGLQYFKERGFTDETIKKFQLGYSPEKKDAYTEEALKKGYKKEFLERTGLSIFKENWQADRFNGRVLFPIHSLSGNVIGFGGRIMKSDPDKKFAKYLNSPESELYNKSKTLYGIYFSRAEMVKKDLCILVEGYTDVMSMHQSGIENVVASSGTSLTVEQIRQIQRFTNNILVIYDGDNAGIKASFRGINMILEQGLNVKTLLLPNGEDPDSFAQKHSTEELAKYIETKQTDFIKFKTQLFVDETANDPVERAKLINDIVHSIALIPDQIQRSVYIAECSKLLSISEQVLNSQLAKILADKHSKEYSKQAFVPQTQAVQQQIEQQPKKAKDSCFYSEHDILYVLLKYGFKEIMLPNSNDFITVKDFVHSEIVDGDMLFKDEAHKKVFDIYYESVRETQDETDKILINQTDAEVLKEITDVMATDKSLSGFWTKKESYVETEQDKISFVVWECITKYKQRRLVLEEKIWTEKLKEKLEPEELNQVLEQLKVLSQTIKALSKELNHVS